MERLQAYITVMEIERKKKEREWSEREEKEEHHVGELQD